MADRYDVSGSAEGEYQPGSEKRVLLNKLAITDPARMDDIELTLLGEMQYKLLRDIEPEQRLTVRDLCSWHAEWLSPIYGWAGRFRAVNMEKSGYPFAAAQQIPRLMENFGREYLSVYTPCFGMNDKQLVDALALCHVEYIIIHPFREGNGRISRVLATVMALQAGMPLLDFSWFVENRETYIAAIHHGHNGNYDPIKQAFSEVLKVSLASASKF